MRLKPIISHVRDIRMVMHPNTIVYSIPLYSEKEHLGQIKSIKVVGESLVITAQVKPEPIKEIPFDVSFS